MGQPSDRTQLTEHEYETLRRATETYREELVFRLCGECGLRASEIARLRPADVSGNGGQRGTQDFLQVREAGGETRTAYLPSGVAHDFWQYVRSNDIDDGERVIGVSERRIQMLVTAVGERAASTTGRTLFEHVTPTTLRQYFGRQLLVEHALDVRVVASVGGWQGVDSLLATMDEPTRAEIAAAFERIERRPDERPGLLARLVTTLESVDEELIAANTRSEIETRVCEQLTDIYRAAWILERDANDRLTVRAHTGESPDRFGGAADSGVVRRALQTGGAIVAPDEPGPVSDMEGRGLLGAIPLSHSETEYGVLVVRTDRRDAFEKPERTALTALGRRIAFAITATERRLLLLGGTVLELTVEYSDQHAPLVELSRTLDCTLELDGVVPGEDGTLLCFVEAYETTAEHILEAATERDAIADARLIQRYDDGGRIELTIENASPLLSLLERGATVTGLHVEDGSGRLVCEVSPKTDVRRLYETLAQQFPTIDLRSKQERSTSDDSRTLGESLEERLTDRQRSVLEGAYHAGYFEWPRGSTAEDLADSMGVSSPTLHNHLRKAQQKLLEAVLEE